jgi:hypothetical protein
MSREIATAYTGSNVSIFCGSNLITNVFGVSWELSQGKRPVYGYNSMYFDAIATGQVLVLGQLYINYQHPNYLSNLLQQYHADKGSNDIRSIANSEREILQQLLDNVQNNKGLNSNLSALNVQEIFENPKLLARAEGILSRGQLDSIDIPLPNLLTGERGEEDALYRRPDQFSSNQGLKEPLDIIITHGDPNLGDAMYRERTASYVPSSSIILRNIHFIGESQQVMSDDQPIMEVYKFIARNKQTVLRAGFSTIRASQEALTNVP